MALAAAPRATPAHRSARVALAQASVLSRRSPGRAAAARSRARLRGLPHNIPDKPRAAWG